MATRYKSQDICRITGCTHRQLQYWEKKGYLSPTLGGRNIRYYTEDDVRLVKQIISMKKRGKSLGEAFTKSQQQQCGTATFGNIVDSDNIEQVRNLTQQWFQKNMELLDIADSILQLENSIPRFPYFIYSGQDLDQLKLFQEKARQLKMEKDHLYMQWKSASDNVLNSPVQEEEIPKEPAPSVQSNTPYSVDQLVILWMRKHGHGNLAEIRQTIIQRLQKGESIESIAAEINAYPDVSS